MTNRGGARRREAALTATAFTLCLVGGVVRVDDTPLSWPPAAVYLIAVVSCAVLPLRHRAPLAVLAATTVCGMFVVPLGLVLTPIVVAPAVVTAYTLAVHTERRTASGALLVSAGLLAGSNLVFGDVSWEHASRTGAVVAFPLVAGVLGRSARNRRAYLAAVEERAWRAEKDRESEARRRVAEERVRIARELHDLVAHQITLANAQATVAAHFFDTRPEQARTSLRELVGTTGDALNELRATVGLLRQTGDTADPAEPAPGLSRLPTLLASFRRAGLEVSVRQEGTVSPLPPGVDLTAYRIVQEALTNVTKHAGTGSARVSLAWERERVTVTVTDDGAGTVPAPSPGYGLIGMRERATAVGGHLFAGGRAEGGFLVSAELPVPPAKDTARGGGRGTTGRTAEDTADEGDGDTS